MTTMTTDTPDGERLARLEVRVENVERGIQDIREDIRGLREDYRGLRTEIRVPQALDRPKVPLGTRDSHHDVDNIVCFVGHDFVGPGQLNRRIGEPS